MKHAHRSWEIEITAEGARATHAAGPWSVTLERERKQASEADDALLARAVAFIDLVERVRTDASPLRRVDPAEPVALPYDFVTEYPDLAPSVQYVRPAQVVSLNEIPVSRDNGATGVFTRVYLAGGSFHDVPLPLDAVRQRLGLPALRLPT